MNDAHELRRALEGFIGTEVWYRDRVNPRMLYTDGVQFFAEHAGSGAYWFLSIVSTELMSIAKKEPFIHIKMVVDRRMERTAQHDCVITADDGNDNKLWTKLIVWTDCPEGEWAFYLEDNGQGSTLLLPSEH